LFNYNKIFSNYITTRKKEEFRPIKRGEVKIYSCGPTVYSHQHIGNLRTYINWDIVKRVFLYHKYKVNHVINVTDVGHLTSDRDTGEDKVERAAKKEGKRASTLTKYYFDVFLKDLEKLDILAPKHWPKASDHIKEQIALIKKLEKKGYTYKTSDGIYFDSSRFRSYGKLANLKINKLKGGKRVKIGEKKSKTDFALWKFSPGKEKRQQEWESPWGVGFPGWHLECSSIAMSHLGKQLDVHTGGIDQNILHDTVKRYTYTPLFVVATLGTTVRGSLDNYVAMHNSLYKHNNKYIHVDMSLISLDC